MSGLRVVVTGGAKGIGAEIVRQFRKSGATVDILDIDRRNGMAVAQATGACFRPVDISDNEKLEEVFLEIIRARGDIDVIINDAAKVDFVPLEDNDAVRFMESLRVNVVPVFTGARILKRHRISLLPEGNPYGGRIINIASTRAFMSERGTENYTASKGAIVSLTHALMMSLSEFGITVNSISPGWIITEPTELTEKDIQQHPSGRVGSVADIASACLFIAGKGNNFLNGENITIDGGMTHKMIYEP